MAELLTMELQKVCDEPEVFMLRTPDPEAPNGFTNCFILRSQGECLVIDVGSDSDAGYATFMDAFERLGVSPDECSFALTHMHVDHAGMVERLVPRTSMLHAGGQELDESARCHESEYPGLLDAKRRLEGADEDMIRAISYFGATYLADFSRDRALRRLAEGNVIRCGACELHVLDTAGHSVGHLSFFEPRYGLLFCGDAVLFSLTPMTDIEVPYRDGLQRYFRTLEKLDELDVRVLLQGHGVVGGGDLHARARQLKAHFQERAREVAGIVRDCPGLTGVEVMDRMTWGTGDLFWRDANPALLDCVFETGCVALDHVVEHGLARREVVGGVYRYF